MIEPTQIAEGPVLTDPEASNPQVIAPGQENILEEFIQEQQAASEGEAEKLLGKFNSTEDLAKAYQELERKLGQNDGGGSGPDHNQPSNGYTADQARELYGTEAVDALAEQGVDLADLMWKADTGVDISENYDTLAAAFNVPRQVVENYVSSAQKGGAPAPEAPAMTAADEAAIKEQFGGEQGFAELSQWAEANLPKADLDSYNAVVDSGNKAAIEWALRAISARRQAPDAVVQPKLIGGGAPTQARRFESKQQVLDAMNKRNERGQRLYDVDEAYRDKVVALIGQSDVF